MSRPKEDVCAELVDLVRLWTAHEDVPKSQERRAEALGRELHALGGMALMRDAYYHARDTNRCASVLNLYWHGIGEWMA